MGRGRSFSRLRSLVMIISWLMNGRFLFTHGGCSAMAARQLVELKTGFNSPHPPYEELDLLIEQSTSAQQLGMIIVLPGEATSFIKNLQNLKNLKRISKINIIGERNKI